jgi:hypothetical protein
MHSSKVDKRIRGLLALTPKMDHAGWNVTLKVTSSSLQLVSLDTGEPMLTHDMPNISFASGGEPVSYRTMTSFSSKAKDFFFPLDNPDLWKGTFFLRFVHLKTKAHLYTIVL